MGVDIGENKGEERIDFTVCNGEGWGNATVSVVKGAKEQWSDYQSE